MSPKSASKTTPFWEDSPLVREGDVLTELSVPRGSSLFLGRYSLAEVVAVLGKRGFLRDARKRGLGPLHFSLDSSEHPLHRFRIFNRVVSPETVIVDLKVRESTFAPKPLPDLAPLPPQSCLAFEWLTLQNPRSDFSDSRSALPGQAHPGLSLSRKVLDTFVYLGRLMRKDALLAFPAYFHNALLFSRYFRFYNPEKEGEVRAIRQAFHRVPFKQLAWIIHLNCLRRGDGAVYEWTAEEQLFPLAKGLRDWFDARAWRDRARAAARQDGFSVDWDCFARRSAEVPRAEP